MDSQVCSFPIASVLAIRIENGPALSLLTIASDASPFLVPLLLSLPQSEAAVEGHHKTCKFGRKYVQVGGWNGEVGREEEGGRGRQGGTGREW
jgi:hypothetical protein